MTFVRLHGLISGDSVVRNGLLQIFKFHRIENIFTVARLNVKIICITHGRNLLGATFKWPLILRYMYQLQERSVEVFNNYY